MADSAAPSAGRVFISYRREETAYAAGWLFDRLADRFGRGQIFKDIDSIQLGDDFVEVITTAVGSCDVLLALIGEQWLTITDEHGTARLDNPDDFVRLEIEAALTRNVRVIPILVAGARMPRPDQLPPSLAKLARRQALELSPSHFEFDTSRLHKVLDRALAEVHAQPTITEPDVAVATRQAKLRALYVEARAETRLGHFQTAIDLLDDLLALDPSHRDAAQLRAAASQQLHLADTYQRAVDAEAASEWTDAANAYTEILDVDPTYRDAAARREACQARQQLLDLQGELRHHATAGHWQAVLDVDAELGRLDPSAADPDGLATQAQHVFDDEKRADDLAHRYTRARNAEDSHEWAVAVSEYAAILSIDPAYRDAAARREAGHARQQLLDLQGELRHYATAGQWQAVLDVDAELGRLDPAATKPDGLATQAQQAIDDEKRADDLAHRYTRARNAEDSHEWAVAVSGYRSDSEHRPCLPRCCRPPRGGHARQQLLDLQGDFRHYAAAGQWQAVLDVDAELGRLDPAATDPDGLATQAQQAIDDEKRADDLAHRYTRARNAEDSHEWAVAVSEYAAILQLDPHYRDTAARQDRCVRMQRIDEVSPARPSGRERGIGQRAGDLRRTHRARSRRYHQLHRVRESRSPRKRRATGPKAATSPDHGRRGRRGGVRVTRRSADLASRGRPADPRAPPDPRALPDPSLPRPHRQRSPIRVPGARCRRSGLA